MTTIYYLALLVTFIVLTLWCFNHFACPASPQQQAWMDAQQALERANRDVDARVRLRGGVM